MNESELLVVFLGERIFDGKYNSKRRGLICKGSRIVINQIIRDMVSERCLLITSKEIWWAGSCSLLRHNRRQCASIIYYSVYVYNYVLFTDGMMIYSDLKVSDFLYGIMQNQHVEFLNEWNRSRNYRDKIYFFYVFLNKDYQVDNLEINEFRRDRAGIGIPIINHDLR